MFLDSPVHGFNPPHEQEAPRDHLRTQVRRTREEFPIQHDTNDGRAEEFPVQPETNDGRAEVQLILMLHFCCRHRCQC